jgi:hypothetical protein
MNPSLDIATGTEAVAPTDKMHCGPPRYDPGGGGINVARVVRILGGEASAVFPAGGPGASVRQKTALRAVSQKVGRDTAEDPFAQARMTISTCHDQIGADLFGDEDQLVRIGAFAAGTHFRFRGDAMPLQKCRNLTHSAGRRFEVLAGRDLDYVDRTSAS